MRTVMAPVGFGLLLVMIILLGSVAMMIVVGGLLDKLSRALELRRHAARHRRLVVSFAEAVASGRFDEAEVHALLVFASTNPRSLHPAGSGRGVIDVERALVWDTSTILPGAIDDVMARLHDPEAIAAWFRVHRKPGGNGTVLLAGPTRSLELRVVSKLWEADGSLMRFRCTCQGATVTGSLGLGSVMMRDVTLQTGVEIRVHLELAGPYGGRRILHTVAKAVEAGLARMSTELGAA